VSGLRVGDPVWVGVETNPTPGHILSIHRTRAGRTEYVIRTLDLDGRPGDNLNLRVRTTDPSSVVRPRVPGPVGIHSGPTASLGVDHVAG
jgi:hypothetical protein